MRFEARTATPPGDVVARAVAELLREGWAVRSMSDRHLHMSGKVERDARGLKTFLVGATAGLVLLSLTVVFADDVRLGGLGQEELLLVYLLVVVPTALAWIAIHLLSRRGEAGVVVTALPDGAGGARVFAQAFGSAFARDEVEGFLERLQRDDEAAMPVRLADRTAP